MEDGVSTPWQACHGNDDSGEVNTITMKEQETASISGIVRGSIMASLSILVSAGVACTTNYDSSGRQVQSVDPGAAVAGAAAAGIVGYAIGRNNDNDNDNRRNYRNYRSNNYYRGGSRGHYHR